MKFKVLKNQKWLFWAGGMVIYPFVIFNMRNPPQKLFKHELEHCYQIRENGVFKFYASYVFNLLRHGYKNNPYEIPAFKVEAEPLTENEMHWYQTGVIELD